MLSPRNIIRKDLQGTRKGETLYCWINTQGCFESSYFKEDAPATAFQITLSDNLKSDIDQILEALYAHPNHPV